LSETTSRSATSSSLAHFGRVLRVLADRLGAHDARPRQLVAGYGRFLIESADRRRRELGIGEHDALRLVLNGLVPARVGTALVFLDPHAEEVIDDLARFADVAKALADSAIVGASDADELADAVMGALDSMHAFLMANDAVTAGYVSATTGEWLESVLSTLPPSPRGPEVYETLRDRSAVSPDGAAKNDLALAA
jgi:hypothetical protein